MSIVIYSKDNCSNCTTAINLCNQRGVEFVVKKLDVDYTADQLREIAGTPRVSMPVIVIDDAMVANGIPGLVSYLKR